MGSSRVQRVLAMSVTAGTLAALAAAPAGAADQKVHTVKVKLTDAGCPAKISVAAGPTTFKVTNDGADEVSEFEVLDDGHILGEVENLAPGLDGQFSLTLKAGQLHDEVPGW